MYEGVMATSWNNPKRADVVLHWGRSYKKSLFLHGVVIGQVTYFDALLDAVQVDFNQEKKEGNKKKNNKKKKKSQRTAQKKRTSECSSNVVLPTPTYTTHTTTTTSVSSSSSSSSSSSEKKTTSKRIRKDSYNTVSEDISVQPHRKKEKKENIREEIPSVSTATTATTTTSTVSGKGTDSSLFHIYDDTVNQYTIQILKSLYTQILPSSTSLQGWLSLFREGVRLNLVRSTLETWLESILPYADMYRTRSTDDRVEPKTENKEKKETKRSLSLDDEEVEEEEEEEEEEEAIKKEEEAIKKEEKVRKKKEKGKEEEEEEEITEKIEEWLLLLEFASSFYKMFKDTTSMQKMVDKMWERLIRSTEIPSRTQPHHLSILFRAYTDKTNHDVDVLLEQMDELVTYCTKVGVDSRRMSEFYRTLLPHCSTEGLSQLASEGTLHALGITSEDCLRVITMKTAHRTWLYRFDSRPLYYPLLFSETVPDPIVVPLLHSTCSTSVSSSSSSSSFLLPPPPPFSSSLLSSSSSSSSALSTPSSFSSSIFSSLPVERRPILVSSTLRHCKNGRLMWAGAPLLPGGEIHVTFECTKIGEEKKGFAIPSLCLGIQPIFRDWDSEDDVAGTRIESKSNVGDIWEIKVKRDVLDDTKEGESETQVRGQLRGPTPTSSWRTLPISYVPFKTALHITIQANIKKPPPPFDIVVRYL